MVFLLSFHDSPWFSYGFSLIFLFSNWFPSNVPLCPSWFSMVFLFLSPDLPWPRSMAKVTPGDFAAADHMGLDLPKERLRQRLGKRIGIAGLGDFNHIIVWYVRENPHRIKWNETDDDDLGVPAWLWKHPYMKFLGHSDVYIVYRYIYIERERNCSSYHELNRRNSWWNGFLEMNIWAKSIIISESQMDIHSITNESFGYPQY